MLQILFSKVLQKNKEGRRMKNILPFFLVLILLLPCPALGEAVPSPAELLAGMPTEQNRNRRFPSATMEAFSMPLLES